MPLKEPSKRVLAVEEPLTHGQMVNSWPDRARQFPRRRNVNKVALVGDPTYRLLEKCYVARHLL
jgi:hypothetical protein